MSREQHFSLPPAFTFFLLPFCETLGRGGGDVGRGGDIVGRGGDVGIPSTAEHTALILRPALHKHYQRSSQLP